MSTQQFPKPDAKLAGMIERFYKTARSQIADNGEILPAALILHGDNEVTAIPAVFKTESDKNTFAFMVRALVESLEAHAVCMIFEMWTLRRTDVTPEEYAELRRKYKEVQYMPGRKECVTINIETRDGQVWTSSAEILRKGRAVTLAPVEYYNMAEVTLAGCMVGWFAPEKPVPDSL